MKPLPTKINKLTVFNRIYIKICINIIQILEYLINSRKLLFVYNSLYYLKYLHTLYTLVVILNPFIYLFTYHRFLIPSDIKLAFIADGNRRYLKKQNKNMEEVKKDGLSKINEIIDLCNTLKISEVGFFCLSIKNFKRSDAELENILQIFKYRKRVTSCRIRVFGNLDLLPEESKNNLKYLEESTKNNEGVIVNLFIAYSSQDEIENGIKFYGNVDLIVRTSGEKRLSDFLILQCCKGSNIFFCDALWPEITIFHVWLIIFKYKLEKIFFNKLY
jgi:ditrans,polycis-polyprenyl diphosphate synthase